MSNDKKSREKYRLEPLEFGKLMRGLDAIRRKDGRSPDFFADVSILFKEKYESTEEREVKQATFTDILKFAQKHGVRLAEEDYIRALDGTMSFHEDLIEALVTAPFLDEPDESGSYLDESAILERLEL